MRGVRVSDLSTKLAEFMERRKYDTILSTQPLHKLLVEAVGACDAMVSAANNARRMNTLTNGVSGLAVNVNYGAVEDALQALRAQLSKEGGE
jgi:hypothetical protein